MKIGPYSPIAGRDIAIVLLVLSLDIIYGLDKKVDSADLRDIGSVSLVLSFDILYGLDKLVNSAETPP